MSDDLRPLIDAAKAETHPFVVVFLSDAGIHWRAQTQSACQVMADILSGEHDCRVMPREEFIAGLELVQKQEEEENGIHNLS